MSDELLMRWDNFEHALARRAATSTRDHLALATEQFRGLMREVVKITPPGHEGVEGGTKVAQAHGQAKAAADVRRIYGSPNDAYELIKSVAPHKADAFWFMHKQDRPEAATMFRTATGKSFSPLDGGELHQRMRKRRGGVGRRRTPVFYVRDERSLEDYIEKVQGHVMFLTAGWKQAFQKLGISLPQFITKHSAPGAMTIEISETRIHFVATDAVKYAASTDLQRRIQHAIDAQTGKMQRQWEDYQTKLNAKAGL